MAPVVLALALLAATPSAQPWLDARQPPERRAEALQRAMTLEEELAVVHGSIPVLMRPRPADVPLSAGFFPALPRLGIPALRESDASLGVANARRGPTDDATALPSGLSLAAGFDPDIAFAGGAMIGREARAKGFNVLLAGGVNLVRDPRNGRNFEYFGEDPLLAGTLAGASIRGVQSNGIVSTIKHFALNAQETGRQVLDARIDPAALRESDLLAFEVALEQGRPGSVMCAYNRVNGAYACENPFLLNDVLKRDWSFKGWVMSDWGAVHATDAALKGLDQESGQELDKAVFFGAPLAEAVRTGAVPRARLDEMARRILYGLYASGAMDRPVVAGGLDLAADGAVAQAAAEAGIVLLKNERGVLPLVGPGRRIAVIGGHADVGVLSGGGSSQVIPRGSTSFPPPPGSPTWGGGQVYHPSPPTQAFARRLGLISWDDGAQPERAAATARGAAAAVVFATSWSTEGKDTPLALPDGQDALIAAVAAANPRTVVVLETGGPVLMPWLDKVAGVVEAWYPGSRGGEAIARVLFGEVDATGRLPVSFPRGEGELPRPVLDGLDRHTPEGFSGAKPMEPFAVTYGEGADVGYRWYASLARAPLFPFGHGLSYTRFRFSDLRVTGGRGMTVSFAVTNTGVRAGSATPQVYATAPGRTPRLVGWRKLALRPGETRRVTLAADPRFLAPFDAEANRWRARPGVWRVDVGASSADLALHGEARLAAMDVRP